jgi:hypothetical protein
MTQEEIKEAWNILRLRHDQIAAMTARGFQIGDKVQFKDKNGGDHVGTVTKINRKTVGVRQEHPYRVNWNVAPAFLTKAD